MSAVKRFARREMIESARLAARLSGCTCRAEVELRELRPGMFCAEVLHDSDCAHPSQKKGRDA